MRSSGVLRRQSHRLGQFRAAVQCLTQPGAGRGGRYLARPETKAQLLLVGQADDLGVGQALQRLLPSQHDRWGEFVFIDLHGGGAGGGRCRIVAGGG